TKSVDLGEELRLKARRRERLMSIGSPVALLLAWEAAARLGFIDIRFFPAPSAIIAVLIGMLASGELAEHILISLQRITPGVLQISPIYLDVGKSFKASRWDTFRTIALPGALPFIMTGIKLGAGLALILIAIAEMVGAKSGIGYMIWSAWETFAVAKMYVGLFTIALIGFGISIVLREVERWVIR